MLAYSYLKRVLSRQHLSVPELHRRIRTSGIEVNVKSLYRLSNEHQPVERLDMRVAGAICQVCAVPLTEWIVFADDSSRLQTLDADAQKRLNTLMTKNNEGQLDTAELAELRELVRRVEELTLYNARLLAAQHQRRVDAHAS